MSLKTRGILVVVIGTILGVSLALGGGVLADRDRPAARELTWEQARMLAEVMERVKRDYVEPIDDAELLESAIRGMFIKVREKRFVRPANQLSALEFSQGVIFFFTTVVCR